MNAAVMHLAVNHVPLVALIIAGALLVAALLRRSASLLGAAIWITIAAGVVAIVALQSGEAAEHLLEHVPGINTAAIEQHEEQGKLAAFAAIFCAGIGIGILLGTRWWGTRFQRSASVVLLLALIGATILIASAAHAGGYIRHADELENRLPPPALPPSSDE